MPRPPKAKIAAKDTYAANLGFEAKLLLASDKLRTTGMRQSRAERDRLPSGSPKGERRSANQYQQKNIFWVPANARWSQRLELAQQSDTMRGRLKHFPV